MASKPYQKKAQDRFGAFLRTAQKKASTEQEPASGAMVLLSTLKKDGPMPTHVLIKESGLSFSTFSKTLENLKAADLVEVRGQESDEEIALTERGDLLAGFEE